MEYVNRLMNNVKLGIKLLGSVSLVMEAIIYNREIVLLIMMGSQLWFLQMQTQNALQDLFPKMEPVKQLVTFVTPGINIQENAWLVMEDMR